MNTRPISALAATRSGLLSAIGTQLPDEAMSALVSQLADVEWQIVTAPCNTYAELAVKTQLLAEKMSDQASYDPLIAIIIEQLPRDLAQVERGQRRAGLSVAV